MLLPENLFYNTPAPGVIFALNRHKALERKRQFLLVNAAKYFVKEKPKNRLTDEAIASISDVFQRWETRKKLSRVITLEEVRQADYNLSPSFFVDTNDVQYHRPLAAIMSDLDTARAERRRADEALDLLLANVPFAARN